MTHVKICGVTQVEQAIACVELGAAAVGLNFAPRSPRRIEAALARRIVEAVAGRALCVGVFVDADAAAIERVRAETGIDCVQLHGAEPPELLARFLPHAYKALRVRGPETLSEAGRYGGDHLLLDAYVPGLEGGSGHCFDWSLAAGLSRERKLTLAGGLTPDNVAQAVRAVKPFCVDVASGVERAPGDKDMARVEAFMRAVVEADA